MSGLRTAGVLIVIGVGGMGRAVVRRVGPGHTVFLADFDVATLEESADVLAAEGYDVRASQVNVSNREQLRALADAAAALDQPIRLVHTAGLSPAQASATDIVRVDLLGVALSLEEFGRVVGPGGSGVIISSMAGHLAAGALSSDDEAALARTPADELLQLPFVGAATDPGLAYALAKRANHLRVQAAASDWGARGARVNSISPGIISTSMGRQELASPAGELMRSMVEGSPVGRLGTPDDIAGAAAFLLGPDASFVTGTDLLVDGGVVAGIRSGRMAL